MIEIQLIKDVGTAKKGSIYIQGLHGVPDFPYYKGTLADDWYWLKGSEKSDLRFIKYSWFGQGDTKIIN